MPRSSASSTRTSPPNRTNAIAPAAHTTSSAPPPKTRSVLLAVVPLLGRDARRPSERALPAGPKAAMRATVMRTRVIRMGNSRGVRLPKALLDQCGIEDVVELTVTDGGISISAVDASRAGWAEAAQQMAARGEDGLLDRPSPTAFDESQWRWPD